MRLHRDSIGSVNVNALAPETSNSTPHTLSAPPSSPTSIDQPLLCFHLMKLLLRSLHLSDIDTLNDVPFEITMYLLELRFGRVVDSLLIQ